MRITGLRSPLIQFSTLTLAIAGLLTLALPPAQASIEIHPRRGSTRVNAEDYQVCANQLSVAGIAIADVSAACGAALYPQDVSHCVVRIQETTALPATNALTGCRAVRRPVELAVCVSDIDATASDSDPQVILNNCRRSLLPVRYSACVVGLSRESSYPTTDAMQTCIAAGDRPYNVLPNFIPSTTPLAPGVPDPSGSTTPGLQLQ